MVQRQGSLQSESSAPPRHSTLLSGPARQGVGGVGGDLFYILAWQGDLCVVSSRGRRGGVYYRGLGGISVAKILFPIPLNPKPSGRS